MKTIIKFTAIFISINAHSFDMTGITHVPAESSQIRKFKVDNAKTITKYPSPSKRFEINFMEVNGRSPEVQGQFIYNTIAHFTIVVLKGRGRFSVEGKTIIASKGDMIDVPPKTRFAVEGQGLQYLTVESPPWFSEQYTVVDQE